MTAVGSVLMFGTYDASLHPRVAVLRDGLSEHGWDVTELNEPLGLSTADKVQAASSSRGALRLGAATLRCWSKLLRQRRRAGSPDIVVVGYMGHLDVHLARLLFSDSTIVLDHLVGLSDTVRDRGLGSGVKLRILDLIDRSALDAADTVVVDTVYQAETLPARSRRKSMVVPVGATGDWTPRVSETEPTRMRVVFFGLFTPLQGTAVIGEAISLLKDNPGVRFTMIGTGQDLDACRSLAGTTSTVNWIDWVEPAELPRLVAAHDVCLGIFGTGPKAQRVVPTKAYQGMAAGCALVTGDTPAARSALQHSAVLVPCGDALALAQTLAGMASNRDRLARLKLSSRQRAESFRPAAATDNLSGHLANIPVETKPTMKFPPLTLNAWLRWDLVEPMINALPKGTVLEVGPGEGAIATRLAKDWDYTGVELSARASEIARRRLDANGAPSRIVGSMDELDDFQLFDLVCAFEVIEHIENDLAAMDGWVRRLRQGGTMIVTTPAGADDMGPADHLVGHLRRYDPRDLNALMTSAGLEDVEVRHCGYPFGFLLQAARNLAAAGRLRRQLEDGASTMAEGTEKSSSYLQPPSWAGSATRLASWPGRAAQRRVTTRGPGLLAIGRRPD